MKEYRSQKPPIFSFLNEQIESDCTSQNWIIRKRELYNQEDETIQTEEAERYRIKTDEIIKAFTADEHEHSTPIVDM